MGERLERAGLLRSSLDLLFARTLRDAVALEVAGDFHRFRDVMAGSLQVLFAFGRQPEPEAIDRTLNAFSELPPFPEAAAGRRNPRRHPRERQCCNRADVQGARRAGWRAAWVSRLEKQFPAMHAGNVTGSTLEEAVGALLSAS